jgi:polar amino acid transport system permease protein
VSWSWHAVTDSWPLLISGLKLTVEATLGGSIIALVLGLVLALIRMVRVPILWRLLVVATEFLRGTPLLVQLYFAFFVLPTLGIKMSGLTTGICVLGLYNAYYMAEVYRAAVQTVAREQIEAATALNLPALRRWRAVVLPQALPAAVPALGNYVIAMFKESALLSTITVGEMLYKAQSYGQDTYRYVEPLTVAGLLYFLVSYVASVTVRWLERRTSYVRS